MTVSITRLILITILSFIFFTFCNEKSKTNTSYDEDKDSLHGMTIREWKQHFVDSAMKSGMKKAVFDTAGISLAPIKVLNAKIIRKEYSSYRDIRITFKNVSNKKISAVEFAWYGETAFGEPADMGNPIIEGYGRGTMDISISPGKSMTLTWNILSKDAKKVIAAWPVVVVFNDETKWKLKGEQ